MAYTNRERGGSRTNPAFDAFREALASKLPHVGASDDIFYNYCANCVRTVSGVVLLVSSSASEVNRVVAENFPRITFLAVSDVDPRNVSASLMTGGRTGAPFSVDPFTFADYAYECLRTDHTCHGGVTHPVLETGRLDRVNMDMFHRSNFRTSHHMNVSALLRCPNEPFRTLDFDLILVDSRTREVKLIIEESADAGKCTYMSEKMAQNVGAPVAKIITRDPYEDRAEIVVMETRGRRINAPIPRFASYREFLEEWCLPNLA